MIKSTWWQSDAGFFGKKYIEGDNSEEGFIPGKKERLYQRTNREVNGILLLTNIQNNSRILDVPCGYGRHSIELAKRKFMVTGIDINDEHLQTAKERGKDQKILFLKKDMRNIGRDNFNSFDLVINMFYSFGFFEKDEENLTVMKQFYEALKEGGKLLLHTDVSPEIIANGKYQLHEKRSLSEGKKLVIEETYDKKTKRIEGSWEIVSSGKIDHLTPYSVRIYSKKEFEDLAKSVGFTKIEFYGSFNGEKFTRESSELIMIAEK